jgi:hypothetical protein
MNPAAILALISDLYSQVTQLTQQVVELRRQLAEAQKLPATPPIEPVRSEA